MKYLKNNFSLSLPGNGNYYIDLSLENGKTEMVKFLIIEFHYQPSLYAKQMATILGHTALVFWVDEFTQPRNETGVRSVHRSYDRINKEFVWDDVIPHEFRHM
jgi:hypothetical protein